MKESTHVHLVSAFIGKVCLDDQELHNGKVYRLRQNDEYIKNQVSCTMSFPSASRATIVHEYVSPISPIISRMT
jgi:hypothetical protein